MNVYFQNALTHEITYVPGGFGERDVNDLVQGLKEKYVNVLKPVKVRNTDGTLKQVIIRYLK